MTKKTSELFKNIKLKEMTFLEQFLKIWVNGKSTLLQEYKIKSLKLVTQ